MTYTIEEVARILKVSTATVRRLIKSGELKAFKVGHQSRVTEEVLRAYMTRSG